MHADCSIQGLTITHVELVVVVGVVDRGVFACFTAAAELGAHALHAVAGAVDHSGSMSEYSESARNKESPCSKRAR